MRDIPWKALAFTAMLRVLGIFGRVAGFVWDILAKAFTAGREASEDMGVDVCERLDKWRGGP